MGTRAAWPTGAERLGLEMAALLYETSHRPVSDRELLLFAAEMERHASSQTRRHLKGTTLTFARRHHTVSVNSIQQFVLWQPPRSTTRELRLEGYRQERLRVARQLEQEVSRRETALSSEHTRGDEHRDDRTRRCSDSAPHLLDEAEEKWRRAGRGPTDTPMSA